MYWSGPGLLLLHALLNEGASIYCLLHFQVILSFNALAPHTLFHIQLHGLGLAYLFF